LLEVSLGLESTSIPIITIIIEVDVIATILTPVAIIILISRLFPLIILPTTAYVELLFT